MLRLVCVLSLPHFTSLFISRDAPVSTLSSSSQGSLVPWWRWRLPTPPTPNNHPSLGCILNTMCHLGVLMLCVLMKDTHKKSEDGKQSEHWRETEVCPLLSVKARSRNAALPCATLHILHPHAVRYWWSQNLRYIVRDKYLFRKWTTKQSQLHYLPA